MRTVALILITAAVGCSSKERAFDVAYSSEWKFSVAGPVDGYALIVNTGDEPLNLNTLEVKSVTDDSDKFSVKIAASPKDMVLEHGKAAGSLSLFSEQMLVESGIVSEPRADKTTSLLNIEIENLNFGDNATADFHATAELALDGVSVSLPMTIHLVPGPDVYADPMVGKRVALYR